VRKSYQILLLGLALTAAVFCGTYLAGTREARQFSRATTPELAWLKSEFQLDDEAFARVSQLHEAYQSHCEEICARVRATRSELEILMQNSKGMTEEIERKLEETTAPRLECQKMMLRHCYETSQAMPPEQGKRYFEWIKARTFQEDFGMPAR